MSKEERIYQNILVGVVVVLSIILLIFFMECQENYIDLLEVNEQTNDLLDKQRESHKEIVQQWEKSYEELQMDYGALLAEKRYIEQKQNKVEIPVYDFTEAEIYLIAQCVEAEAGYYDNHELSQQYVTQVILNRLHSGQFPNSVEEVIYQKTNGSPQFSVAYNGMMDDREVEPETLANVYSVIVHGTDLPEYVLFFNSESSSVSLGKVYVIEGGMVFYYKNKEVY